MVQEICIENLTRNAFIDSSSNGDVPNVFKKVDILYSKFGVDDFDFDFYNKTPHSGLETNVENSYSNCLLQLYRFIPSIFNFVIKTLAEDAIYDDFVLTELGYLFDMLVKGDGKHCIASNFQRMICGLPDAQRLGLLNNDGKSKDEIGQRKLIHTFNRFLLSKIALDEQVLYNSQNSRHLDMLCGVLTETSLSSMYCTLNHKRTTVFHCIDINTIPPPPIIPTHITILNYMESSMNKIAQC
ncbi:unnamed protein product [Ambrosiozyma monospora]|uniref:Unnamed protein product n=1 Tax=Ambrosiozyma monospora TaxID=43982 RepID=A0ACB5TXQ3_AMBMO|nr:unnamed protein product [Ambrosiozyma monospora]